ncbi:hypothetical protein AVEN_246631-1 [Araneus ventricosus]|uniref:Uncharacterized protein n=1 Tax=Araneus ventricosus TaxID=182803 RepID=A0A4Y2LNV8_ARAVE|nr:hypothetical protein AVEN_246631-1 [Araneus ventricosus]
MGRDSHLAQGQGDSHLHLKEGPHCTGRDLHSTKGRGLHTPPRAGTSHSHNGAGRDFTLHSRAGTHTRTQGRDFTPAQGAGTSHSHLQGQGLYTPHSRLRSTGAFRIWRNSGR